MTFIPRQVVGAASLNALQTQIDEINAALLSTVDVDALIAAQIAILKGSVGSALDTLDEIAAAINDDASFSATMVTALAGKQPLHANLTGLAALVDPNADRIVFWDDSAGGFAHLTLGTNLSITGTTLDAASTSFTGGLLSSELGIVAGTAAAPGLYFAGDTNTGLHAPAADTLGIVTAGVLRWKVDPSGHLLAEGTNTYDIGAAAGNKPRSIYAGTGIIAASYMSAPSYYVNGSVVSSPSDGVFTFYNNGGTNFGRAQFGGTTSSFPALKRAGATLEARLADDSAYTTLKASILEAGTSVKFPDATTQTTAASNQVVLLGSWVYSTNVANVEITFTADTYAEVWVVAEEMSSTLTGNFRVDLRNASTSNCLCETVDTPLAANTADFAAHFMIGRTGGKRCGGILFSPTTSVPETAYGTGSSATSADRVRISYSSGNIDSGSLKVYGIKAA